MTIKQGMGDGMCAVCVAAMVTNTTTYDVYLFMNDGRKHGDPIHDTELAMYLLKHGWIMGRGWQVGDEESATGQIINDPKMLHMVVEGIEGIPCYLAVKSRNYEGATHAVYWDGHVVRDPDPRVGDEMPLGEYQIISCSPLHYCGFTGLTGRMTLRESTLPYFVKRYRQRGPKSVVSEPSDEWDDDEARLLRSEVGGYF